VGNILSASKGLGYVAKERIELAMGRVQDKICLLKGISQPLEKKSLTGKIINRCSAKIIEKCLKISQGKGNR